MSTTARVSEPWWQRITPAAWLVWGIGAAIVVALDGSPAWQVLRALAVLVIALGGAVVARRRLGPVVVVGGLVAGSIGLAAGLTIGVRDLLAGGPVVRGSAALLVSAASLVLIVASSAEVLHHVRRWWRLAVVPALVLGVALVGFVVAPGVAATNVPPLPAGDRTPAELGIPFEDVRMRTSDGVELAGWWTPSSNGAAVVLRHGAGSTKDDVLDQLAVLARAGYGVLATDARGHGDSGGRAMDFGWYGDAEIDAALTWLAGRDDVDPDRLALVGLSMGGEEVLGMAADPRVRAVVAEGATGRAAPDKAWLSSAYGVQGTLQRGIEWLQTAVTDLLTDASAPTNLDDAIASSDIPILLVTADLADEVHAARWLQSKAPERVQVWVVDGAAHTGAVRTAPDAWTKRVVGLLDETLATTR